MRARKKILLQGAAGVLVTTVGLLAVGATLTATQKRTVAFEYRSEPAELEPTAAKRPELERRRPPPPAEGAGEAEAEPEVAAEPKNGDPPAGMLESIAAKMIDNAIATFWSVINALIVAVTMRRYSKAGKEGSTNG